MLVLSRKRDEVVMIGHSIRVTIIDVRGDKVRLGIEAPAEVPVHRREVYDRIEAEKRAGASNAVDRQLGEGRAGGETATGGGETAAGMAIPPPPGP
jgi:carbon storage regulator